MGAVSARDWIFQINDGSGNYLEITKIQTWDLDKGANNEEADAGSNDSDGVYEGFVMQRGATMQLDALHDMVAGVVAPGQARVEAMSGDIAVGAASLTMFRWRHISEALWRVWTCYVMAGGRGGGHNDLGSWTHTFTKSGPETTAAV